MPIKVKIDVTEIGSLIERIILLGRGVNKSTADEVGKVIVNKIRSLTAKGISPIKGNARFPAYKNPKRYPGRKKAKRPVNLRLSGLFMKSLSFKSKGRGNKSATTDIFYDDKLSDLKESGHREGVNSQPKRPTLPQGDEKFSRRITDEITKIYKEALEKKISKIKF